MAKCVLMLVPLDRYGNDAGGNKFPSSGFIKAKNFTIDHDIRYGLIGVPWGRADNLQYEDINFCQWAVVQTEWNISVILVDPYYKRYKFESGSVLYLGNIEEASNLILDTINKKDDYFSDEILFIKEEEIIGTKNWKIKNG